MESPRSGPADGRLRGLRRAAPRREVNESGVLLELLVVLVFTSPRRQSVNCNGSQPSEWAAETLDSRCQLISMLNEDCESSQRETAFRIEHFLLSCFFFFAV